MKQQYYKPERPWFTIFGTVLVLLLLVGLILFWRESSIFSKIFYFTMLFIYLPTPLLGYPLYAKFDGKKVYLRFLLRKKEYELSDYEIEQIDKGQLNDYSANARYGFTSFYSFWGFGKKGGKAFTSYVVNRNKDLYLLKPKHKKGNRVILNLPNQWLVEYFQKKGI